jgi:hypothetical protein
MFIKTLKIILIFICLHSSAWSLPNLGGERDIEFNIFELGAGLVDSSVMRFKKCVPGAKHTHLEKLLSDGAKLDCNSTKNNEDFCRCVNAVAGKSVDREKITKDIRLKYTDFLRNNVNLKKEFMSKKYLERYTKIANFVGPKDQCIPSLKYDEEVEVDQGQVQEDIENYISMQSEQQTPYDRATKQQIMSVVGAMTGGITNIASSGLDIVSTRNQIVQFTRDFLSIPEIQSTIFSTSTYNGFMAGPRSIDYTEKIRQLLRHPSFAARYPSLSPEISSSIAMSVEQLGIKFYDGVYFGVDEIQDFIKNGTAAPIDDIILTEFEDSIAMKCRRLDTKIQELEKDNFLLDPSYENEYKEFVLTKKYDNYLDKSGPLSFREFVNSTMNNNNELKKIDQRFKADIFYCEELKLTQEAEYIITSTAKNEKDFKQLNEHLQQVRNLTNEIYDTEDAIQQSTEERDAMIERKAVIQQELIDLQRQQKELKQEYANADMNSGSNQIARQTMTLNERKIEEKVNQIKGLTRNVERQNRTIQTQKRKLAGLKVKRDENRKKMVTLLDGNTNAAQELERRAMALESGGPSLINYDSKTNTFSYNKRISEELKNFKSERHAEFKKIEGFSEAQKKLVASGEKSFLDETPKANKLPQENRMAKKYFSAQKNERQLSKAIQEIPPEELSTKERAIQSKLRSVDEYERILNENIKSFTKASTKEESKVSTKSSTKLNALREEIQRIKEESNSLQEEIKSTEPRSIAQVENTTTTTPVENIVNPERSEVPTASNSVVARTNSPSNSSAQSKGSLVNPSNTTSSQASTQDAPNTNEKTQQEFEKTSSTSQSRTTADGSTNSDIKDQTADVDSLEIYDELVLSQEDFLELKDTLDEEVINQFNITKDKTFAVDTPEGRVLYNTVYEDGKVVRFEKIRSLTKEEVIQAHQTEIEEVSRVRKKLLKHSDLVNIFTDIIN